MAFAVARSAAFQTVAAPRRAGVSKAGARSGARPTGLTARRTLAKPAQLTVSATPVEVAQLAVDGAVVSGSAAVIVACTLIGLALGFVLLRVESLVEEGKL